MRWVGWCVGWLVVTGIGVWEGEWPMRDLGLGIGFPGAKCMRMQEISSCVARHAVIVDRLRCECLRG